jgi:hypothetical protein
MYALPLLVIKKSNMRINGFIVNVSLWLTTLSCSEITAQCAGIPAANTVVVSCSGSSVSLGLMNTYTQSGITYSWVSSSISQVGPFNSVPGGTLSSLTPTALFNTWYTVIITCTNSGLNTTPAAVSVNVVPGTTTNNVAYYEGFEGITVNNQLPNCSWAVSSSLTAQTCTAPASNLRVPHSGNKFACFYNTPSGQTTFYSNGIYLSTGLTYSAGLWFQTPPFGNFSSLTLLVGPNQAPAGQFTVAMLTPPVVQNYSVLGGMFTVASSGLYYVAVQAVSGGGSTAYLCWDDLEVTAPCTLNSPSITVTPSSATLCAGDTITLIASSPQSINWNNGTTGTTSTYTAAPTGSGTIQITGSNTLSGCISAVQATYTVKPRIFAQGQFIPPVICLGKSATIVGTTNSYTWSEGPVVTPTAPGLHLVTATSSIICAQGASLYLLVNPLPTVSITGTVPAICQGEILNLTAGGALVFKWNYSGAQTTGSTFSIQAFSPITVTLTGTDANGCVDTLLCNQLVSLCEGIAANTTMKSSLEFHYNAIEKTLVIDSGSERMGTIEIFDVLGGVSSHYSQLRSCQLGHLPSGLYFVRVQSYPETKVCKFIVD